MTDLPTLAPNLFQVSEIEARKLFERGITVYQRTNVLGAVCYYTPAVCPECGGDTSKPGALCRECLPI